VVGVLWLIQEAFVNAEKSSGSWERGAGVRGVEVAAIVCVALQSCLTYYLRRSARVAGSLPHPVSGVHTERFAA